jgi:hypothetical protein
VLHEELPQVFAVFTVVFECDVMFAEMLGDCFIDSLLHGSAERCREEDRPEGSHQSSRRDDFLSSRQSARLSCSARPSNEPPVVEGFKTTIQ